MQTNAAATCAVNIESADAKPQELSLAQGIQRKCIYEEGHGDRRDYWAPQAPHCEL